MEKGWGKLPNDILIWAQPGLVLVAHAFNRPGSLVHIGGEANLRETSWEPSRLPKMGHGCTE